MIANVIFPYFKGGAERLQWELAARLAKKGHKVIFLTGKWEGMKKYEIIDGIEVHGLYNVKKFYNQEGRKSIYESLIFAFKAMFWLLSNNYDIVHVDQPPMIHLPVIRFSTWLKRKPVTVVWHEIWNKYWYKYLGVFGFIGFIIERTTPFLFSMNFAVSLGTYNNLISNGVSKKKLTMLFPGIDLSILSNGKKSIEKTDLINVIYFGRLIPHKNVDVLIETAKFLPSSWKIVIIGDGPMFYKYKKQINHLPKEAASVIMRGSVNNDELYQIISRSSVFVSLSEREGFGMSVLEALAFGLPTIIYNHPMNEAFNIFSKICPKQIISVNELDPTKISKTIIKAFSNNKKEKCSSVNYFDWDKRVSELENTFYTNLRKNT